MKLDAVQFEEIALGEVLPSDAQKIMGPVLKSGELREIQRVYTALRAWTWKALNEKRRDEELRAWYQLLKGFSTYLSHSHPLHAERLQVLYELIYESISVSEVLPVAEVLNRTHVAKALTILLGTERYRMDRSELRLKMGVKQANLTRIMNMALSAGLVARSTSGKAASYSLTAEGVRQALKVALPKPREQDRTRSELVVTPKIMRAPLESSRLNDSTHYEPRLTVAPEPQKAAVQKLMETGQSLRHEKSTSANHGFVQSSVNMQPRPVPAEKVAFALAS